MQYLRPTYQESFSRLKVVCSNFVIQEANTTYTGTETDLLVYWKLNENTTTVQQDQTSGNRDLTLYNTPTWTSEQIFSGTYTADVVSYSDYYPFGMQMPGRNAQSGDYRYGFNGMEKDDEIKGNGNSYDFGARLYDSRLGKWMSRDPLAAEYTSLSPYVFAGNTPVMAVDPDGKRLKIVIEEGQTREEAFNALQKLTNEDLVLLNNGEVLTKTAFNKVYDNRDKIGMKGIKKESLIAIEGHAIPKEEKNLPSGTKLINDILDESETIRISAGETNSHNSGNVEFNSEQEIMTAGYDENGTSLSRMKTTDDAIVLAHELIHGYRYITGQLINSQDKVSYDVENKTVFGEYEGEAREEELRTSGIKGYTTEGEVNENDIRKEQDGTKRTSYGDIKKK